MTKPDAFEEWWDRMESFRERNREQDMRACWNAGRNSMADEAAAVKDGWPMGGPIPDRWRVAILRLKEAGDG